ncbi:MAG: DUF4240 domain-containing protein [Spongiibacteraceae bacterium]|nr:DUF4240 domain-containing protein [Spongiibacteraceae bacterium]MBN4055195.1 DUF4240 domain-containing protein [bacterium AH-315-K03]
MNEREFWNIIGKLDWDASGDDEAVVAPMIEALVKKSNEDIFQFEEFFSQKLFALDTMLHAREIGKGAYINDDAYFSVDGFLYSRCVVVANGKELFDCVLDNPQEFPNDMEFEALLYVAQEAYVQKNKKEWEYVSPTDYETYKNSIGWK